MAMRREGIGESIFGVPPRQPMRRLYEDFQPTSELKEELGAYVLYIHLPGFLRDQLKITYDESTYIIKAEGERRLANSKWSRFNQIYNIPENCILTEITAKFERGILIITMPKKIKPVVPKQVVQKTQEIAPKPDPQKAQTDIPTKVTSTPKVQADTPPKVSSTPGVKKPEVSPLGTQKAGSKVQDDISPKVDSISGVAKPKDTKLETPLGTHKTADRAQDDIPSKVTSTSGVEKQFSAPSAPQKAANKVQDEIPKKPSNKIKDDIPSKVTPTIDSKKQTETKNSTIDEPLDLQKFKSEQKVMAEKSAKLGTVNANQKAAEKKKIGGETGRVAKNSDVEKDKENISMIAAAKEAVNRFANKLSNDDKQSLMNIGAAVIVIVALGSYISYNFAGSSGKPGN